MQQPDIFETRVLEGETDGGPPQGIRLILPSAVRPGESFRLRVAVVDQHGFPARVSGGDLRISMFGGRADETLALRDGVPPVAEITGLSTEAGGFHRCSARLNGRVFYSNPLFCGEGLRHLYWGDPHIHTVMSDCHADRCRTLNFCYTAARWLSGLDWVAAADHVSNGRCDFSRWKEERLTCDQFNSPREFVTLHAYEASLKGGAGGDNNVYLREPLAMFVDEFEGGNVKTLHRKLEAEVNDGDFFIVPHHTSRTGKHGEIGDAIYPGPRAMPLVEIHSRWGTSEYPGNPMALREAHDGPSYARDFLNRGLRMGFVGGTDTHATMTFSRGLESDHITHPPGLTAVRTRELSRDAIFDGLRDVNCYATSGERFYLEVSIDGLEGGGVRRGIDPSDAREIRVRTACRGKLMRAEVIRNGSVVHSEPLGGRWFVEFTHIDREDLSASLLESRENGPFAYYYVRVLETEGRTAWSSPAWLYLDG